MNVLYHMYMGLYINFTINLLGPMDFQLESRNILVWGGGQGDGESSLPNDIVMADCVNTIGKTHDRRLDHKLQTSVFYRTVVVYTTTSQCFI